MSNTSIQLKKSGVTGNVPVSLEHGELAINYADGKLFYRHANGTIASISTGGGSGSASDSFSTINVNSTLVLATSPTDILNFTGNNGIAVTADGTSKTINISGKEVFDFAQAAFDKANVGVGSANTGVFAHVDTFTADGTSDTYILATTPVNQEATLINIDGVTQQKTQYTLSGRNVIFTEVPYSGTKIEITSFSNAGNGIYVVPNVTISATPGTYGNSTTIPTITVDEFGRVTYAANNNIVVPNDLTANVIYITGVDLGQNAYIQAVESYAQSAYAEANAANNMAQAAYNLANTESSYAFAKAAFDAANTAASNTIYTQGVDLGQNTHITNLESYSQSAYALANTNSDFIIYLNSVNATQNNKILDNSYFANAAYAQANTNATDIAIIQGVNLSQNTHITNVEGYSESAYAQANSANNMAQAAYNQANTNSLSISYLTGVNVTQNTDIQAVDNYSHTAYAQANTNATNISIIQAVNLAQNTYISNVENFTQSAFVKANTNQNEILAVQSVNNYQNTYISHIEQYAESAYAQANTNAGNISVIQGVDLGQNTHINQVESYAQAGYAQANTNAGNISVIQGVDLGQNTYISNVESYTQSGYAQANAATNSAQSAYNKANTGGTITGPVTITDTTQSSTVASGALIVDGGVGIAKNLNVGGNAIFAGDLTIQGTQYITSSTTTQYTNPIISLHTPASGYIVSNDGYDIGIDYEYYSSSAPSIRVVTGGSANGTYATLNITDQGYLVANSVVTVSGVTPSGFNGTYSVSDSTPGTVTFPLALTATIDTTGALGTLTRQTEIAVTGATWIGGGTKEANVSFGGIFSSIVLPVGLSITTTAFNPTGYNTVATITSSGQGWIRFSLSSNPGSYVSGGKIVISQRHAFAGRANDTGNFEFYKSGNFTPANTFEGIYGTVKAGAFLASPSQSISAADITAGGFIRLPNASIFDNSTAANGIVAQGSMSSFGIVQVNSVNANVTYGNMSTVYIAGSPITGNNTHFAGNTYSFEVASGKSWFGGDVEFHSANGITFYDQTYQTTAAAPYAYSTAAFNTANSAVATTVYLQGVDNTQNTNITAINNYAQSGYAQANAATNSAQAAFNKANSANVLAQSAYDSSNTANSYLQTYTNTVVSANLIAAKSYTDTVVNANVSIIAGIDSYQNNYILQVEQYTQSGYSVANNNILEINAIKGVNNFQNTYTINVEQYAQAAYNQANTNTSQINDLQSVNLTQNTFITNVQSYAQSGYALANTNATNINIIQGVDVTQNTNITNIQSYAQSGYAQANAANNMAQAAYNTANTNATNIINVQGYAQSAYAQANATNSFAQGAYNKANNSVQTVSAAGPLSSSNGTSPTISLNTSGVATGTYGGSSNIPVITVDTYGRITSAANTTISIPAGTTIYANSGQLTANASTGNVALGLATTGVSAQTYGNTISIPSITVDSYGRITNVANNTINTGFNLAGNTGLVGAVGTGDTLNIVGINGTTTRVSGNTVTISGAANTGIYTSVDSFTANGTGTTFVLSSTPFDINNTLININGVTQQKSTYTLAGNTIFLSAAPFTGANVEVSYSYNSITAGTYLSTVLAVSANADKFTANGTGTTFVLSQTPSSANTIAININGVTQQHTNYSLAGNVVTFNTAPYNGDNVEINYYYNLQNGVWLAGPSSVTAGTYGSSTAIPSLTVDQYGRITSVSTTSITTGTTITNETASSSTYYPMLSTATTGTISAANTSSTKLYFSPSSGALSATSFNAVSDENEKTNIELINNALEITENLNGVTYNWVDSGLPSAGLIAQDVEKWLPQLVATQDGRKSLNYNGIIGVLVEAVKDLSVRVKELESKKPRKKKSLNDN